MVRVRAVHIDPGTCPAGPNSYFIKLEIKMRILKCPVCQRYPIGPIYACAFRHAVCAECRPKVTRCPRVNCRSVYFPERNLGLEKRFELARFACLYRDYGCKEMLQLKTHEEHVTNCEFRPFCCPNCKLQVPVDSDLYAEDYRKINDQELNGVNWLGQRKTNPEDYKQFLTKDNDPWLCTQEPEPIEGFPDFDSVMMEPIQQPLMLNSEKTQSKKVFYRMKGGNVVVEVLPKKGLKRL